MWNEELRNFVVECVSHMVQPSLSLGTLNMKRRYVLLGGDRHVTFRDFYVNKTYTSAPGRKENYHHPRSLMLVIELLSDIQPGCFHLGTAPAF